MAVVALVACGGGGGGGGGEAGAGNGAALDAVNAGTSGAASSAPAPNVVVNAANPAPLVSVFDGSGAVDAVAYKAVAAKMSQDEGVAHRYGSPSTSAITTARYPEPGSNPLLSPYSGSGFRTSWQVGGPIDVNVNDYSSNHAQIAFVSDNPAAPASTSATTGGGFGISTIETLGMRENTYTQSPGLSWTMAGAGLDDSSVRSAGVRSPVALGRCYGRPGWCVNSLVAFQNGSIGTAGSNTSVNSTTQAARVQLENGSVPTAVAVTNGGEFALVTVWDSVNVRGRLAVIALSEKGHDTWTGVTIPGIPNQGAWGFMKVLGYVELPDMKAPTDVSVSTGVDPESMHRIHLNGQSDFLESTRVDLRNESVRQTFAEGGANDDTYARAGIAVVTSKSERKVTFVDLKPLFAYYRATYFTAGNRAGFDNAIGNIGTAANQWPYAFSHVSSQIPSVIKTVALASSPTAVKVSLFGPRRAWVATQDGQLHIYNVGEYAGSGNGVSASTIAELGTVNLQGTNPTHIAYNKHDFTNSVIVVMRGDRKIVWVNFAGNGGSIGKTLQDSRMIDPVTAEDNDNHGTESSLLTVADYSGKKVSNYRWGPVIFHTNAGGACPPPAGCGISGNQPFEFGGSFALPGKPFHITGANVP